MSVCTLNREATIRYIIDTYELPDKLKEKILKIATWHIAERQLQSLDSIDKYISELVEKFQFNGFRFLSLDSTLTHDSKTTYHDVIGIDDTKINLMFCDGESLGITLYEAVNLLRGQISQLDLQLMHQLIGKSRDRSVRLDISQEELLKSIPQIHERLRVLASQYERDGIFVVPKRPILYVNFQPSLSIKFGIRRYRDPLAYFRENLDTYGGMSRSELEKFDQGLYSALKRTKKLELAIPETKIKVIPALTIQQIEEIITAHSTYNGNARETARNLSYATCTILKYWKAHGLKANGKLGTLPPTQEQIDRIIAAHQKYRGNASEAERNEPYSKTTFLKYWIAAGLKILPRGHPLIQEEIDQLLSAYSVYGGDARRTSRNLGYDLHTIHKYWNKAGLRAIGKPNDAK